MNVQINFTLHSASIYKRYCNINTTAGKNAIHDSKKNGMHFVFF